MTRLNYYNRFNLRQRAIEKSFAGPVYQAMRAQYNSFLNSVQTNGYAYSKKNIDRIVTAEGIVKVLKRMYRRAAYIEGNYVLSSLIESGAKPKRGAKTKAQRDLGIVSVKRVGSATDASFALGFDEIATVVDEYFKIYHLNVSGLPITETTRREIEDHLIADVERGMPLNEAVSSFRDWALTGGTSVSRNRAKMIIQTESTRAMSFGSLIGAYKSGIDVDKQWVTSADEKVRTRPYPHTVLDGQVTGLFGAYNNGEAIKFPGDPDASKANTANCRCTQFFKQKARPRPRIVGRSLMRFLSDFFTGFFIGTEIYENIFGQNEGIAAGVE